MNYKHVIFIALVLMLACVIPASAVWSNGNWIDSEHSDQYFGTAKVVTDPQTGVTSKYNPVVDSNPDRSIYGWARFMLRSGGIGDSTDLRIWVSNKADNLTFDSRFNPDGTEIDGINPGWLMVPILPDGRSEQTLFAAGDYVACLADSNGGQPECQEFNIGNADVKTVPFLGHAISHDEKGRINDLSISGYLGRGDINLEWIKPVIVGYHPFTYPAWDSIVHHNAVTHIVHHDAVTHTEHYTITDTKYDNAGHNHGDYDRVGSYYFYVGMGHGDYVQKVKCTNHAEHGNGWHTQTSDCTESHTVIDVAAYDETVVDVPAWNEIIHHPAVTIQIPEYGFEIYVEIDGAHLSIDNPNRFDVNVDYAFDINYFIDNRPYDPFATPNQIKPRTMHYTGTALNVAGGTTVIHQTLTPDIDDAVMVVDWSHYGTQYVPTLENARITATAWS